MLLALNRTKLQAGGITISEPAIDSIHRFWFGELDSAGMSPPAQPGLWFGGKPETDTVCRARFGDLTAAAVAGELESWAETDRGLLALVLLLDQMTRNIYRGTPQAFAGDPAARALAREWVSHGHYQRLPAIHQVFLYMPLEHSEEIGDQETCVELFEQLAATTGSPLVQDFTRYARAHRDVILRFGRFPHRNAILGRDSSAEELAHLAEHGGF